MADGRTDLDTKRPALAGMVMALGGVPLEIRSLVEAPFTLANSLRLFPSGDGRRIFLPNSIRFFDSDNENHRLYRLYSAYQAAQWEASTLRLEGPAGMEKDPLGWVIQILDKFPMPLLAAEILFAVDIARIKHFMKRRYGGLRIELEWLDEALFAGPWSMFPSPLAEALHGLNAVLAGMPGPACLFPGVSAVLEAARSFVPQITADGAALSVSARVAGALYPAFARLLQEGGFRGVHWGEPSLDPILSKLSSTNKQGTRKEQGQPQEPSPGFEDLLEDLEGLESLEMVNAGDEALTGRFLTDEGVPEYVVVRKDEKAEGAGIRVKGMMQEAQGRHGQKVFRYQEWNYLEKRYLRNWVSLFEVEQNEGNPEVVEGIISERQDLIEQVRRQFRMLRSDSAQWRKKLETGDEVDIWEVINRLADQRAGLQPSDKVYMERRVRLRDISALILLDMSASTDARVRDEGDTLAHRHKVIDVAREGLVVIAEALQQLGDSYAVFGFSGYGRHNVEYYPIKFFGESLSTAVKARIAAIEPKKSTRMGPAIRHSITILEKYGAREKLLLIISDGYPQDHDYGEDRRNREYGLQDTRAALREAEGRNIRPFCITIDHAGHDYLRRICKPSGYLVVDDVLDLPEELPKIYKRLRA